MARNCIKCVRAHHDEEMWLELELDLEDQDLCVRARGSRGERPPAHAFSPSMGVESLQNLAAKVGRAIRAGRALDPAVLSDARTLFDELFQGDLRDVLARLREASAAKESPLLLRLFLRDRALQSIPWEVLCRPGTSEGFLGTDPKVFFARGVTSPDPWEPRDVLGAVRVLAIAPGSDERSLTPLKEALAPAIEAGEIEWLEPIAGPDIGTRALFDRLRRGKSPHVIHWIGHGGVDPSGKPVLRVADDEDGDEAWISAEALGRELANSFCEELRLVILEACEGARAGAFGSAAEILAAAGADAVVAFLWPVKANVARICSSEIYRSLAGEGRAVGDIGASVAAARRTLLTESAEAFSPVLFLRGAGSVIFDFHERRIVKRRAERRPMALPPALQNLLERPFSLILGDLGDDKAALRNEFITFLNENGETGVEGLSLSALAQRCTLKSGSEYLLSLFQQTLTVSADSEASPLIGALARFTGPGVHVTVIWNPYLERAIGAAHPRQNVYAIQLSLLGTSIKARVVKRAAGASAWKAELVPPKRFELDSDIVILKLYGGYSAEHRPILSRPVITEDDHIYGLLASGGLHAPTWLEELLARIRVQPGLFVGLSSLEYHHRILLRWLYDHRQAPNDSLAILMPGSDPGEPDIWEGGGGLPGGGRVGSVVEDPDRLAAQLDAFSQEGA